MYKCSLCHLPGHNRRACSNHVYLSKVVPDPLLDLEQLNKSIIDSKNDPLGWSNDLELLYQQFCELQSNLVAVEMPSD